MLDYVEKFDLPKNEHPKYVNELQSLHYLRVGLELLYKQVKKVEDEVSKRLPHNKVCFYYGNAPELKGVPKELIACSFHWYAVSVCNYALLVGWLRKVTEPNSSTTAKGYLNSALPKEVIDWRNKVAAHFARTDDYERDNPAECMVSTLFPFGFYDDAFHASPMKLTITQGGKVSRSDSLKPWSLTKLHEELRKRYWPAP
jgi:hypothetical protein